MKQLANYLLTQLVDDPEAVSVEETETSPGVITLTMRVAKTDMGRIIGKEGKVISSIRNLIKIKALKDNKLVTVNLAE